MAHENEWVLKYPTSDLSTSIKEYPCASFEEARLKGLEIMNVYEDQGKEYNPRDFQVHLKSEMGMRQVGRFNPYGEFRFTAFV